ncbi:hypothetical protein EJB05_37962 [Eragrostis curvula]|uniref:F-box domain-containing protein n=1 Tax=Eragrostis curvula TaxID=38414 RepID=A0A5J9TT24_9POAL|nr:hypothetical protein EJB05_37962 [Eragrostis curvula]
MEPSPSPSPPRKESEKRSRRRRGSKAKGEEGHDKGKGVIKDGENGGEVASRAGKICGSLHSPPKNLFCSMAPPPTLPDDLIPEILVRVPPDDPAGIVRSSAVCKAWRRILADPAFSVRYRKLHHRTTPVLGFLHNPLDHEAPRFVPTTSFRLPTADRHMRHVWDCRHGRVLLYDYDMHSLTPGFVVWDPITGDQQSIPYAPDIFSNAAVVCTAGGSCDHRSCSGGPFIVAFAGVEHVEGFGFNYLDAHADFYSPETSKWGLHINIHLDYEKFDLEVDRPAALVGDSLYFVCKSGFLLRYWYGPLLRLGYMKMLEAGILSSEIVTVIEPPKAKHLDKVVVMTGEDGGLGLASLYRNKLSLWARETDTGGEAGWVRRRVIDLKTLLPLVNPKRRPCLSGVIPEGANVIFISTEDGVFTIELKPLQARKICEMGNNVKIIYPFVSFYTETLLFPRNSRLFHIPKHLCLPKQGSFSRGSLSPRRSMAPPARPLPDDLIPEILLLVPPDDPASIIRSSAVCKAWRRILADPAFSGRYRALHHGTAPVLGFLHNPSDHEAPRFVPTAPSSFRLPTGADRRKRHVLDCRHGRVVLHDYSDESPFAVGDYYVWDPITGDQQVIPYAAGFYSNAAVICTAAAGGYHHGSSCAGPFVVAFAGVEQDNESDWLCARAELYSPATKTRVRGSHVDHRLDYKRKRFELEHDRPAALVGDSLYFVGTSGALLRYWYGPLL